MREMVMEALKDAEVVKAMKSGSEEEMLEAFNKNGINVSLDELKSMFTIDKELSDVELECVAGGGDGILDNTCGTAAAIPCVVFIVTAVAAFV